MRNIFTFDRVFVIFGVFFVALLVSIFAWAIWSIVSHETGIQSGYIYDKDYSPASDYTTSQTTTTGKTTVTTYTPHHESEKYSLKIRISDDKGGYKTNYIYVPENIWDQAKVGQYFDGECMCFSKNNQRE